MYTLGFDPMSSKSQGSNLMSHQGLPANCKNIIKRFFLVKGRTHYWGKPQGKPQGEGESKRMGNGVEWIMKFEPMHHCCMSQFHQLSWHKILEEYLIRKKMLHLFLKKNHNICNGMLHKTHYNKVNTKGLLTWAFELRKSSSSSRQNSPIARTSTRFPESLIWRMCIVW